MNTPVNQIQERPFIVFQVCPHLGVGMKFHKEVNEFSADSCEAKTAVIRVHAVFPADVKDFGLVCGLYPNTS